MRHAVNHAYQLIHHIIEMMNFRDLLLALDSHALGEFTSREVASLLDRPLKMISADLRRLNGMGFLRRKERSRLCVSLSGKVCCKGIEHIYSFSEQGRGYVGWMKGSKSAEDAAHIMFVSEIMSCLPQELKGRMSAIVAMRGSQRYKGPQRHFRLLDGELFPTAFLISENKDLQERNSKLTRNVESLHKELAFLNGKILGLETVIADCKREYALAREMQDMLLKFLNQISGLWETVFGIMRLFRKTSDVHRFSSELFAILITRFLPQDKALAVREFVFEMQKEEFRKIEEERKAIMQALTKGT